MSFSRSESSNEKFKVGLLAAATKIPNLNADAWSLKSTLGERLGVVACFGVAALLACQTACFVAARPPIVLEAVLVATLVCGLGNAFESVFYHVKFLRNKKAEVSWPNENIRQQIGKTVENYARQIGLSQKPKLQLRNDCSFAAMRFFHLRNAYLNNEDLQKYPLPLIIAALAHEVVHLKDGLLDAKYLDTPMLFAVGGAIVSGHADFGLFGILLYLPLRAKLGRIREYQADRKGVVLTGTPYDLISVLEMNIDLDRERSIREKSLFKKAAIFLTDATRDLLDEHPDVRCRIKRLRKMDLSMRRQRLG